MNKNVITNIFGGVAGFPQVALGIAMLQDKSTIAEGIAKIAEGIGLFVVAYFVGKPGNVPPAQ
jgi:hypothetical protein